MLVKQKQQRLKTFGKSNLIFGKKSPKIKESNYQNPLFFLNLLKTI